MTCPNEKTKIVLIQLGAENRKDLSCPIANNRRILEQRKEVAIVFAEWAMRCGNRKPTSKINKSFITQTADCDQIDESQLGSKNTNLMGNEKEDRHCKNREGGGEVTSSRTPVKSISLLGRVHQKNTATVGRNVHNNDSNNLAIRNALNVDSQDIYDNGIDQLSSATVSSNYRNCNNDENTNAAVDDQNNFQDKNANLTNKSSRSPNEKMKKFFSFRKKRKNLNDNNTTVIQNQESSYLSMKSNVQLQLSGTIDPKSGGFGDKSENLQLSPLIDTIPLPSFSNKSSVQSNLSDMDLDVDIDSTEDNRHTHVADIKKKMRNKMKKENRDNNRKKIYKSDSMNVNECKNENDNDDHDNDDNDDDDIHQINKMNKLENGRRDVDPNKTGSYIPSMALTFLNYGVFQPMTANTPKPIKFENDYFIGHLLLLINTKPICEQYFKRFEGTVLTLCVCVHFRLSICLCCASVYLSLLSVCLTLRCLCVFLIVSPSHSVYLSLSPCLSVSFSASHFFGSVFVPRSICLSIYLSVCLSICLSICGQGGAAYLFFCLSVRILHLLYQLY